ncbi:MAG TPA: ATP-binding protein [Candidatus Binatia bacterium]|jgi:signal transduction histidine kinase
MNEQGLRRLFLRAHWLARLEKLPLSAHRYPIAAIAVGLAVLGTMLLSPAANGPTLYSLSFIAVILSAWYGGLGPGLFATALSALSIDYFLLPPLRSIDFTWSHIEQTGVFMLSAIVIGTLTASRRRAENKLADLSRGLELTVQERTADLSKAYEALQAENLERKQAEAKAAQAMVELAKQNKELLRLQGEIGRVERLAAIGRITGTIAHDIGTPLNSVLGYAQLLGAKDLPADAKRGLKVIETQVERMVTIINQHLSRAGYSISKDVEVDLNRLIRETLELLQPSLQRRGIEVCTQLMGSPARVQGGDAALQRVLMNLIDNAVDAMEKGGTLAISTLSFPSPSEPKEIVLEVADTGEGIDPAVLPKICEMFVTTKAAGKGNGLGLAICEQIVKAHRGHIQVSSEVGKGTTVRVYLPVPS